MSGKFEKILWSVRYITILSVILSIIAAFTLIILGSWEIVEAVIFYNPLFDESISSDIWTDVPDQPWSSTRKSTKFGLFLLSLFLVVHENIRVTENNKISLIS